ncbi:MAG TPA: hypothetical protein VFB99_08560, partial [Vicinamibacterales bacterium]|nr:hypothetical protein [Vicinamibacterales bacterium]
LAAELRSFGATDVRERALGVEFSGPLAVAYRACLESRVASRVFLVVADFDAPNDAAFYEAVRGIDWLAHIDPSRTLACDFTGKHPAITHTRFGALRLKDGICDQLRDATGRRPDIAPERPAVRVHAHQYRGQPRRADVVRVAEHAERFLRFIPLRTSGAVDRRIRRQLRPSARDRGQRRHHDRIAKSHARTLPHVRPGVVRCVSGICMWISQRPRR